MCLPNLSFLIATYFSTFCSSKIFNFILLILFFLLSFFFLPTGREKKIANTQDTSSNISGASVNVKIRSFVVMDYNIGLSEHIRDILKKENLTLAMSPTCL